MELRLKVVVEAFFSYFLRVFWFYIIYKSSVLLLYTTLVILLRFGSFYCCFLGIVCSNLLFYSLDFGFIYFSGLAWCPWFGL